MPFNWISELWRFVGFGILAIMLGAIFGQLQLVLFVYISAWFVHYFVQLVRFERWLRKGKKFTPPDAGGLWGEVFSGIYHMQKRGRKRNKKLMQLLNRFRETTAAMPDGVIVLHEQGDIEWWNDAAAELVNLKYPQDVGQRLTNLIRNPKLMNYYHGSSAKKEVTIPSPYNEEVLLTFKVIPYGKLQKLVTVRDVTLIQQVDRMRRDFVGNISHELRTPLTVLSGYIENLLELQGASEEEQKLKRTLQVMQQQTRRMHRLTDDLLLLSNIENEQQAHKSEIINVPHILASLREEALILSGEKHHTILVEADTEVMLRGDPKEMDSVFTNLVVNAINYTPAGGAIRIRWHEDSSGVHFEVHDTGIGIAQHHIARLTERFYRVDVARSRNTGGSGLGLAIVKHAMQRHGGNLRIDSEIGRGSTFICDFPASQIVHNVDKQLKSV